MREIDIYRTGNLTTISGPVRRIKRKRDGLLIVAPDGTEQLIPWAVITRVIVTRPAAK